MSKNKKEYTIEDMAESRMKGFELGQKAGRKELQRHLRELLDVPSNDDLMAVSDVAHGVDYE